MNMKSRRLDGKLNRIALATVVAIVLSVMCAAVSVVADSSTTTAYAEAATNTVR